MLNNELIREDFPILKEYTYLDSASTSLTPLPVIDSINEYYLKYNANIGRGAYKISIDKMVKIKLSKVLSDLFYLFYKFDIFYIFYTKMLENVGVYVITRRNNLHKKHNRRNKPNKQRIPIPKRRQCNNIKHWTPLQLHTMAKQKRHKHKNTPSRPIRNNQPPRPLRPNRWKHQTNINKPCQQCNRIPTRHKQNIRNSKRPQHLPNGRLRTILRPHTPKHKSRYNGIPRT